MNNKRKYKANMAVFSSLTFIFFVYSYFVYTDAPQAEKSNLKMSKLSAKGKNIWHKHNCMVCHQIYGSGGYLGPDITNVMSTKGEPYVKVILKYGTNLMPDFDLSDNEISDLVHFFSYLDKTGKFPDTIKQATWYGTIKE